MRLLAIDPGTFQSAWLIYDTDGKVLSRGIESNEETLRKIRFWAARYPSQEDEQPDHIVIEDIEGFGMPVGRETFRTVLHSGRFIEAWQHGDSSIPFYLLTRRQVKLHLCNTNRAKDANVRQCVLDRFGGKDAIGVKAHQGPLYGITADLWSAVALAVTWSELYKLKQIEPAMLSEIIKTAPQEVPAESPSESSLFS